VCIEDNTQTDLPKNYIFKIKVIYLSLNKFKNYNF